MIYELTPVFKRWEETHAALHDWFHQFPEERLDWRPAPHATTAAEILAHLARGERNYSFVARGIPFERITPPVHDRASAEAALAWGAGFVREAFEAMTPETLIIVRADEWQPLGPRVDGPLDSLWFLEQMTRHDAYHLGQLWYLSMLLEGLDDQR
jgi:hypothetical protein